MRNYKELLAGIRPADQEAMDQAAKRNDSLLKPLGSLGKLEEIAVKLAGITGKVENHVDKKCTVVMVADNGICEEGVAGTPQEITRIQAINMTRGICGMSVLSAHAGADIRVVDLGIKDDYENDQIIQARIKRGADNFAKGPAMTRAEAEQAVNTGARMIQELVEQGYQLIGTGEMGIGNTSSTSAVLMALTGAPVEKAVGKGGGLTDEALAHKKKVLTDAICLNRPNPMDPVDVVAKVGGLDIAGLAGCFIGAAYFRVPIVIDGVISALAALVACRLNPLVRQFLFPSHRSKEPAYDIIAKELKLSPMLDMDMRLGEGTGCTLAFSIISAACAMLNNMATFEDISFDETYRVDLREDEKPQDGEVEDREAEDEGNHHGE